MRDVIKRIFFSGARRRSSAPAVGTFVYLRPGGMDHYYRPGGMDNFLRAA